MMHNAYCDSFCSHVCTQVKHFAFKLTSKPSERASALFFENIFWSFLEPSHCDAAKKKFTVVFRTKNKKSPCSLAVFEVNLNAKCFIHACTGFDYNHPCMHTHVHVHNKKVVKQETIISIHTTYVHNIVYTRVHVTEKTKNMMSDGEFCFFFIKKKNSPSWTRKV
jgi:hypothetical protein